ncbi:hypothetical protein M409DRAFT_20253 [Zasmidium cellare ATCC 36951]|uniref:Sulfotransferase domain-containing protein n=1 Tax=Zasmidium cellare ATCC 36951 TaxID=1080233 RepID=A0A6A6CUI5_ZASCE|nr:uncharacterized protein M409DRAFT_20253 [Zasmidium cellare ATCC 36951]KAF2169840.1 hypothetical protein M409DRAFT_20253 [Zasmidium cellare ATCC 36951]
MASQKSRKNVLLLTCSRTRSNLVFRWICTSPDVHAIRYPFVASRRYGKTENSLLYHLRHNEARHEELVNFHCGDDTPEDSLAALRKDLRAAADEGKIAVMVDQWEHIVRLQHGLEILRAEHCVLPPNPTHLPDDILTSTTTIILIRHPAAVVDSICRMALGLSRKYSPDGEDFRLFGLVRAHRLLFDSFSSQHMQPIVVDSWDVVTDTTRVQAVLEERLGTQGMTDVWEPRTQEELASFHPMTLAATRVANESSGIKRPESTVTSEGDSKNFFLEWQEKYGDKVAKQLQGFVDRNLPDYEYLRQFRI